MDYSKIINTLSVSKSRDVGKDILKDLTKDKLFVVAEKMDIYDGIKRNAKKSDIVADIVNRTIGLRLKSAVFSSNSKSPNIDDCWLITIYRKIKE